MQTTKPLGPVFKREKPDNTDTNTTNQKWKQATQEKPKNKQEPKDETEKL